MGAQKEAVLDGTKHVLALLIEPVPIRELGRVSHDYLLLFPPSPLTLGNSERMTRRQQQHDVEKRFDVVPIQVKGTRSLE